MIFILIFLFDNENDTIYYCKLSSTIIYMRIIVLFYLVLTWRHYLFMCEKWPDQ